MTHVDERPDLTGLEGRDLILTMHPIFGASPDHTAAASDEAGELLRYLVHVTLPERAHKALVYPSNVDRLVQNLKYAVERMPQLLSQMADRLEALRAHPRFATDDRPGGVTAEQRGLEAEQDLRELASQMEAAAERFAAVGSNTSHLKFEYLADEDED